MFFDFTISTYQKLLKTLISQGYAFKTYESYARSKSIMTTDRDNGKDYTNLEAFIILRHDIDDLPLNALNFAQIQSSLGIVGTYYFRMIPKTFIVNIIQEISALGHEIGYHYETMDTCRGDVDKAYDEFCRNLEILRDIAPVTTISMHGSPISKHDNREIWYKYDYKKLGLTAEPYFDTNFNEVFYLTDTGRSWDGHNFNIRDKVIKSNPITNDTFLNLKYHSTNDIIRSLEQKSFPEQAMLNFHPQRWHKEPISWIKELIWQNLKNQGKRMLVYTGR